MVPDKPAARLFEMFIQISEVIVICSWICLIYITYCTLPCQRDAIIYLLNLMNKIN